MKKYLAFLAVGSFFSTVEEFLTVAVMKDIGSFVVTVLIVFPVFLTFVFFSSRLLDRLFDNDSARELVHFLSYGVVGLMFEWFIMGLSPWSNAEANPVAVAVFQVGMFSFWTTVAFAPRLFLKPDGLSRRFRQWILRFYVPYFVAVYIVAFSVPTSMRFAAIISLVLFGYLLVNVLFLSYFIRSFSYRAEQPNSPPLAVD
jgi:hypothetical protein